MCDITTKRGEDLWSLRRVDIICRPSPKINCRDQIKKAAEKLQKGFPALDQSSKYETGVGEEKLDFLRLTNSRYVVKIRGPLDPIKLFVKGVGMEIQTGLREYWRAGTVDNDPTSYPVTIIEGADLMVSWHFVLGEECEDKSGHLTENFNMVPYAPLLWHPWSFPIVPFSTDAPR
ncbi:MAG: hypothetical protein A3H42_05755 [Deltaproteobacteria bacterium RIFCSPLOWO2_02_FULL_46_8]|nr:MAG: hypothetical protein A3H42_05755 [Deltaproteobacteria bacterium RIFCSPLOWO2_02_FULL_46_8]